MPENFKLNEEPKTENISIRADKKTMDKLRRFSKTEGMSLNAAISTLLAFTVDWTIPASRSGWVPLPKTNMVFIMEKLEDKEIERIAENLSYNTLRDIVLAMRGKYTVKDTLEVLGLRSRAAGFHYNEIEEEDEIHFVMQHNMGKKWSLYFKVFYESALQDLGCQSVFTMTDNTITYTVNKKDYK